MSAALLAAAKALLAEADKINASIALAGSIPEEPPTIAALRAAVVDVERQGAACPSAACLNENGPHDAHPNSEAPR